MEPLARVRQLVPVPELSTTTAPESPTAANPPGRGVTRFRAAVVRLAWRVHEMPLGLVATRPPSPTAQNIPFVRHVTPRSHVDPIAGEERRTQLVASGEV